MSEIIINLRLTFRIPDTNVTINSLIRGLKEASPTIHGSILTTVMKALEERLIETMIYTHPGRYKRNGYQRKRTLKSSLGTITYQFAQLLDSQSAEHRTIIPLVEFLAIPSYTRYLEEATEPAIGLSVHVSYRRAAGEVERLTGIDMSYTTVHRHLQQFATLHDPFGSMQHIPYRFLLVDGTKVRLQDPSGKDQGQAELRWALASTGPTGRFEPVGFWVNTDWAQIRKDLNARLDYEKLDLLFSDGGPGIEENLLHPAMQQQRCQWHGKRDFPYLLYADGVKKSAQQPFREKLLSIPALTFTKQQLETLCPEDRAIITDIADKTAQGFQDLLDALDPATYPKTRVYIQNLIQPVTTFLSWWLTHGEAIPLTTNAVESAFSQVCNRIKRIGRRWSERGLINWLKITFYKIFKPNFWNVVWNNTQLPKIKLIDIQSSYHWA
jgi:hypothetical protein